MRAIFLTPLALAACASASPRPVLTIHNPPVIHTIVQPPKVLIVPRPVPVFADRPARHCSHPAPPALPDASSAPDLPAAVNRLVARDAARADYETRLVAALKACARKQ